MLDRRSFLRTVAAAAVAGGCATRAPSRAERTRLGPIGVQLFTIPKLLEQDFAGTMKLLADIGYKELELFGPYPFSVPAAHERWKSVTPALGFEKSGYFGLSARDVKAILDGHGLTSPSMHIDLDTLRTRLNEVAEAADVLGQRYAGISSIPAEMRRTADDYKRVADEFNEIGARMKPLELRFLYHNHGYGLAETEGQIPFQILIERTDPDLVDLEMDLYWMTAGGADSKEYLDAYPGRFKLMHIKDMREHVRFSGDGGDPQQWIELFPYMTDAGSGVLDLPSILSHAKQSGVRHFFVERDLAPNPIQTLRNNYRYLSAVELEG